MKTSIRDVAVAAGVSVGTVSNVLNHPEKVSAPILERVLKTIEDLGFVRNDAARQLRVGHSRTVGLIVLDVANPFFTDIAKGAELGAAEEGLSILLGNSEESIEREQHYLELFEEHRVRGILISPRRDVTSELSRLRTRGIPSVLVDRIDEGGRFSSVSVNDIAGGELAAQHLIDQGRRKIAFVGGPYSIRQVQDRFTGASNVVAKYPDATIEIIQTKSLTVLQGREAGEKIISRPVANRPDSIFAANDLVAMGILQALVMNRGIKVPDEIAIVGYDDIDFASAAVISLSSIRQPSSLMGQTAIKLLLAEEQEPGKETEQVIFEPELIVRRSTSIQS